MSNTYQKAIENSNIVSRADINGIITFVNDEFYKISGYSYDKLIRSNVSNKVSEFQLPLNIKLSFFKIIIGKLIIQIRYTFINYFDCGD